MLKLTLTSCFIWAESLNAGSWRNKKKKRKKAADVTQFHLGDKQSLSFLLARGERLAFQDNVIISFDHTNAKSAINANYEMGTGMLSKVLRWRKTKILV